MIRDNMRRVLALSARDFADLDEYLGDVVSGKVRYVQVGMTRPTNEAIRRALDAIIPEVSRGTFICWALADHDRAHPGEVGRWIRENVIEARLHPHGAYGSWLQEHHPEVYPRYVGDESAFSAARLCWIEALKEEFA